MKMQQSSKSKQEPNYKILYQQSQKKVQSLYDMLQLQKIKNRKLTINKTKGKLCAGCLKQLDQNKKVNASMMKQDLKDFSQKIQIKLKRSNTKSVQSKKKQAEQIFNMNSFDLQSYESKLSKQSSTLSQPNSFPMIHNFSVFGVSQQNIQNSSSRSLSDLLDGQLLYSYNEPSDVDRQAGRLVFPSGVVMKKLIGQRAKDKAIQMMSFSYANLKSFILMFKHQADQNQQQGEYQKNQFLMHVNPSKKLFSLCIGVYDYTSVNNANQIKFSRNTDPMSLKHLDDQQEPPQQLIDDRHNSMTDAVKQLSNGNGSANSVNSGEIDNTEIYISQRVFCISSYYPFFTFYQEILRSLMNIIKMQRLMYYKQVNQNVGEIDSKFQLQRMQKLFTNGMRDLNSKPINFNRCYQLKLINLQKITLMTQWNLAKTYFIQEWVFSILSMFTVQTFVDVFTLMMLEDRIVFICNNSHILTFTIYLFTNILIKPLKYPFQVVSILPEQGFLGAPFPVVYGLLRKRTQVQKSTILRDYPNTYIFLSPFKVDIVETQSKKHLLKFRPQKLKNDLTNLFRDLKKQRFKEQKNSKMEIQNNDYALISSTEQRQNAIQIVQKTNEYILQQILNKIPNQYEINSLKNSIDFANLPPEKDEHSVLMQKAKNLAKKTIKDLFVQRLLDTQLISNIVCK